MLRELADEIESGLLLLAKHSDTEVAMPRKVLQAKTIAAALRLLDECRDWMVTQPPEDVAPVELIDRIDALERGEP